MYFAPVIRSRSVAPLRGFDRSFERFLNGAFLAPATTAVGTQFSQDDKSWTITLDLPGVPRDALTVDIEGSVVRLQTKEDAKRQFKAAWELPEEIDADASSARLEDGVLTLTLGKKKPVSNARQIAVN